MNSVQIYKIARREYIARVRNKAFIFSTVLVPLFMGLYAFVMPLLFSQTGTESLKLALVDTGTGLNDRLAARLATIDRPRIEVAERVESATSDEGVRSRLNEQIRSKDLDGYILLTPDPEILATAQYFARETGNPVIRNRLENAVHSAALERMLEGTGVDVERVRKLQRDDLETVTISEKGEQKSGFESALISTIIFAMLLYMAVIINGQGMALAIVEEKSSRLIEVILGAVTATEFMLGKVLGVLMSGLTQLAIWIGFALIVFLYALPALAMSAETTGFDLASIVNFRLLFYFSIFFALGYLFYSTLFAALAATCTSTEELSQAMFPAMLPLIFALMATFYVASNPATGVSRVLSLIPFMTPLVMLARINVLMPPLWEVWLSILLLGFSTFLIAWLAARIFRISLLMHGKRPSLPELIRVLRAS